uniref:Sperm-activating peptide (Ser-5 speract) n=1 Tax=Heliocidaris crassispina TaxID=1043166 RepID=Q7M4D7_HELCR
GFDLSGGGVG